jgi:hypothetical protein
MRKILTDANVRYVRSRLTVSVYGIDFRSQNKKWKMPPKEWLQILRMSLGYTALRVGPHARILIMADNAFATHARSGMSMFSKMQIQIITSVSGAEQLRACPKRL